MPSVAQLKRQHWLVDAAQRAGLPEAFDIELGPGMSTVDAWRTLARACGVTEDDLAARVAKTRGLATADFSATSAHALSFLPERVARQHLIFPLRESYRQIVAAVANPDDFDAEHALAFASGRTPILEIATPARILEAIDSRYSPNRMVDRLLETVAAEQAVSVELVDDARPEAIGMADVDASPVINLTNLIIASAASEGASDIHIEPGRDGGAVRFRTDGVMRLHMNLPMPVLNRVVARVKIMGKLDVTDRRRPQDGRARVQVRDRTLDLRISTVPVRQAEKAVIRLLDSRTAKKLDDLALAPTELARFRHILSHRDGIVLVTGPTGSGKTTTLYAALRELATGEVNIMTVEDPIEYELPGLTQIQVEPKCDVTFASALRSILRQDPDIIFVGEIRDVETAEVAVQAAMTGHLVLATLHTNDAVSAVARLTDLGLDRSKIALTLRGVVGQRLIRRVCPSCSVRIEGELSPDERRLSARYGTLPTIRTVGCDRCGKTGFRGRLALQEVLVATPGFEALVEKSAPMADLQKAAVAGGLRSLQDIAMERVRAEETTLGEVDRVLGLASGRDEVEVEAAPFTPHVLVVDDEPINRRLARAVLEKGGFRVSEAVDGACALEVLAKSPDFQLMILDLEMPRLGGLEVLARIRHSVTTAALPVIVLTGSSSEETEIEAMEKGADDYVRKPLDPARFLAHVRAALRRAAANCRASSEAA